MSKPVLPVKIPPFMPGYVGEITPKRWAYWIRRWDKEKLPSCVEIRLETPTGVYLPYDVAMGMMPEHAFDTADEFLGQFLVMFSSPMVRSWAWLKGAQSEPSLFCRVEKGLEHDDFLEVLGFILPWPAWEKLKAMVPA